MIGAAIGTDGINFGAEVAGVTVTWDLTKMVPPLYILSGKFESEATNNDFVSVSAAMEIDKRMPREEPKPKYQPHQLPHLMPGFAPNAEVEKGWLPSFATRF